MSKMTDHGITVELRAASKWLGDLDASHKAQKLMMDAATEIERLRDEMIRIQVDKPFICGFSQGWDAAVDSAEDRQKHLSECLSDEIKENAKLRAALSHDYKKV